LHFPSDFVGFASSLLSPSPTQQGIEAADDFSIPYGEIWHINAFVLNGSQDFQASVGFTSFYVRIYEGSMRSDVESGDVGDVFFERDGVVFEKKFGVYVLPFSVALYGSKRYW